MLQSAARLKVISRVKAIVVKHHFNIGNVDYADWSRAVDEQVPTLLTADDNAFEKGVRDLLSQLKSSHTNFYRSVRIQLCHNMSLALPSVRCLVSGLDVDVFGRIRGWSCRTRGHQSRKFPYECRREPAVPPSFPVLSLWPAHQCPLAVPQPEEDRRISCYGFHRDTKGRRPPLVEPKSVSHRMLRNIGILKIPYFSGAFGISFSRLLDVAVESLKAQGCDRLIIDLRGCLGGVSALPAF